MGVHLKVTIKSTTCDQNLIFLALTKDHFYFYRQMPLASYIYTIKQQ